jgi:hypothetical protein
MASQVSGQIPKRQAPATPTKSKSPSSSVKDSPQSVTKGKDKPQSAVKDKSTPRKLKRKADDVVTPAKDQAKDQADSPNLPPRQEVPKKTPKKPLEQRVPEPEPEPALGQEQEEEQGDGGSPPRPEVPKKTPKKHLEQRVPEPEPEPALGQEQEEEQGDGDEPEVTQKEQRQGPADDQSQASGSATGGFFRRGGDNVSNFAKGLRGAAGRAPTDQAKGAIDSINEGAKDTAKDAAEGVADKLPLDLSALKGLEVGDGGKILDKDGNPLGQVAEGDPEDLVGQTVGDDGEILDEDGDVIGRVEVLRDAAKDLPEQATDAVGQIKDKLPSLEDLAGLPVSEGGNIKDKTGNVIGHIVEGDPEDLVGHTLNEEGEIVDEDGDLIGRAEVISPEEAAETLGDQAKTAGVDNLDEKIEELKNNLPDLADLDGLPVEEGGQIKDQDGMVVGKVVEGDPGDLVGQKITGGKGEIVDDEGDLIGRVEVLSPEEAAKNLTDQVEGAKGTADEATGDLIPDFSILKGKKVNKKGKILDEEGDVIGQVAEGYDAKALAGKVPNEKGEIVDKSGEVIGKVEVVPGEAADTAMQSLQEELGAGAEVKESAPGVKDLASLEGLEVNSDGNVVDSEGNVVGKLESGNLDDNAGKTVSARGLVLDEDGNILGRVGLVTAAGAVDEAQEAAPELPPLSSIEGAVDEAQEAAPELPPLSSIEGFTVNKNGKIVNDDGVPVGELVEGDAKKLSKIGARLDDQGQFWDSRGNVIGKAQTIPVQEKETEAPFAGLEELMVAKDGWIVDANDNRVGKIVDGDAKKLVGRAVDEDGDILDKHGNTVGHAERWEEPEAPEEEAADLSSLAGLTANKAGNIIGPDGVPVGRVVEGNLKEVAGKKIDGEGQIWNDAGKVIGRAELIPENERETKPEGIFGGLEGLVVNKEGLVEDEEGNIVGKVVEGDAKKLRGRAVDEDGDIVDKYGNVKGRAEPYEVPEEEVQEDDLSSLEGKKVNKVGNVVDEHGVVFGRIVSGDPKKMAGRKVDGQGRIWSDNGKVIGKAELIPGSEQEKPEGEFFGFDGAVVGKDGVVVDATGKTIGRIVEGDPKKLQGRAVDEDGDILDKSGNTIGRAERWEPEEKQRDVNPMSGCKINREGEVRDADGNLIGRLTEGNLKNLIGKTIDDNGYVVDNDGNKIGEATLLENLPDETPEEPEISPEELEKQKQAENDKQLANKMCSILQDTLNKIEPVCKQITDVSKPALAESAPY